MSTVIRERYELLETLGAGGEGRVVKALDRQHDRLVALKIRRAGGDAIREELLNEARVLLALPPHPALPLVREDFFDGDNYMVAMDWVDGTDLATLLQDQGRPGLAPSSVLAYLAEAAEALTHLHSQDPPVIHGDLKPANLILTKGGRVKLVDFGLSSAPNASRRRTGTPGFRAPELAANAAPSRASDIYGLAATAFALLSGSAPAGVLPSWEGIDPAQAEQLEAVIRLGMATDPSHRPATPGEFVERLRAGWGSALPTGVVTFCLSDIEGSTALWESEPTAMAEALVRHDELIADCAATHGGRLLKSMGEGDSTVSVFDSAPQALEAALAATRALSAERWPGGLRITARFGVHTGEAERREDGYFGPTINLAARLRGQADGGQIFLSSVTTDLVRRHLPPGCELVDLGPHRLRGLGAPERIHAVKGPGLSTPLPASECPYRGLLAFEPEDRDFFFGREEVVDDLIRRLARGRLLAVVGASGSGKSSVLRAGVIAAVNAGEVAGIERACLLTPGSAPRLDVADDPAELVVVDQFEELFTLCEDAARRDDFIDALLALNCPVAIGMRADLYGKLGGHADLARAVAGNQVLLGAMSDTELERAVTEPARLAGLRLEPGLVELVLRDVAGEPGALPLLSHALRATWERRDGRTLTVEGYRESGGVASALAQTADSVIESLPTAERPLIRNVFLRLTELGEGVEESRRRVAIDELVPEGTSLDAIQGLLERLADARLVMLGESTAEVAHEVLIREWPALRGWLDEDREGIRLHRQLGDAARLWEAGGSEPSDLYRGTRLGTAVDWAQAHREDLNAGERAFLDASVAEADRERRDQLRSNRRLRGLLAGAVILLVVALGAGAFALLKQQDAADSRDRADIARVAAVSRSVVERQPDLGLLLAVAAFELDDTQETRGALLEGLQTNPLLFGLLHGVDSGLEAAVFSPDASKLVTPTSDGTGTIIWSTRTRRRLAVLDHGNGILLGAAISPSGRWLAVPAIYETPRPRSLLQVWDLRRNKLVRLVDSPAGALTSAAFSADGDTLVTQGGPRPSGRFGTEVALWDTRTWRPRGDPLVVDPEYSGDRTVAVSADGELLAVPLSNGGVRVWSSSARKPVATLPATTAPVTALAFTPDASALAIGDDGGGIRFLDPRTAKSRAKPLAVSESLPVAIEYSPEGSRVAVGRADGRTQIFEIESGEPLGQPLAANASAINDVSFSADGSLLATAGLDRTGALWQLDGNRAIGTVFRGQEGAITGATYTPDGATVLTAGIDGSVAARDPETGSIMRRYRLGGEVLSATVSPDGSTLAAGGTAGRVALWPIDDPSAEPISVDLNGSWTQQIAFSPDGEQLAVAVDGTRGAWEQGTYHGGGHVRFVDPATGASTAPGLDFSQVPIGVAFSPDGKLLAVTADNNLVHLYDAETHERIGHPLENVDSPMFSTAFAPNSERLATGTGSGLVLQWNVDEQTVVEPSLEGDQGLIGGVAYSPDGTLLATSRGGFSTTRLWRADDGAAFAGAFVPGELPITEQTFNVDHFFANRPAFSPSGDRLVTTGLDHATVSWTLDPDQWRDAACAIAGRDLSEGEWRQYLPDRDPYPLCEGEQPA